MASAGSREIRGPVVVHSESTRKTYRYLRLTVVALTLLLVASLVIEIGWGTSTGLGSISAYYYTPVRSIFVGSLTSIGFALVAIKGRDGAEDTMLNLAGMLAPVVALVPTPVDAGPGMSCPGRTARCVPAEFLPSVANNVTSLIVVGALALLVAWRTAWSGGPPSRATRLGLAGSVVVWAAFSLWFVLGRASFLGGAHYAAAVPFFALMAGVAVVNARWAASRVRVRGLRPSQYRVVYAAIAGGMLATIAVAGLLAALDRWAGVTLAASWLFVVEAVLVVLFTAFWACQTAENWEDGIPEGA
jgi:hypothetical protein